MSEARAVHRFERRVLHAEFYSEGIAAADFNRDGVTDVVSGPFWYEGPDFSARHELYAPAPFDPKSYSDNFFSFTYDLNRDGFSDVLVVGFPGQDARWYENPKNAAGHWPVHVVFNGVDMESPTFTDLTGDGQPELICAHAGQLGWVTPNWRDATAPWSFHPISPALGFQPFTHGLGVADLDADGRLDVVEATGFWRQPAVLTDGVPWARGQHQFGPGGAQMFALDVDGDSDRDVITTWAAHDYGVSWFERAGTDPNAPVYVEHQIAPKSPAEIAGQVGLEPLIHEPHALAVGDIDGDKLPDLVTGRRFWGHVPELPVFEERSELYWFRLKRNASGVEFEPHLIDADSGVGVDVRIVDVNGDGLPDVLSANKRGAFVFQNRLDEKQ